MEYDVVIVGSGISALVCYKEALDLGFRPILVDANSRIGGLASCHEVSTGRSSIRIPLVPLIINYSSVNVDTRIRDFCTEPLKVSLTPLKGADTYVNKVRGFSDKPMQKSWFEVWLESNYACIIQKPIDLVFTLLSIDRLNLRRLIANISRIDIERKIVFTSIGAAIKYRKTLVYTWPLDLLPKILYSSNPSVTSSVNQLIDLLNLEPVGVYTTTLIFPRSDVHDTVSLYIHGTRASRMHTAVKLSIGELSVIYAFTSVSKRYKPIGGLTEKIFSDLKKHRVSDPDSAVDEFSFYIHYGILNEVNTNLIRELVRMLYDSDIRLYGRIALWREVGILDLILGTSGFSCSIN